MHNKFENITIKSKPDFRQVQSGYSYGTNLFRFPISTIPPAEWIGIFYDVWRKNKSLPMPNFPDLDDFQPIEPPSGPGTVDFYMARDQKPQMRSSKHELEAEIKDGNILLESTIEELSSLTNILIKSIDDTNQIYRELLQRREEKQRAIQKAINEIELP